MNETSFYFYFFLKIEKKRKGEKKRKRKKNLFEIDKIHLYKTCLTQPGD